MEKLFREKRRILIDQLKLAQAERLSIKGVSGTGAKWRQLTEGIIDLQRQIDFLSRGMGLPVSARNKPNPNRKRSGGFDNGKT